MARKQILPALAASRNAAMRQSIESMANGRGIVLDSTREEFGYRWLIEGESIRDIQRNIRALSCPAIEYEIRREMRMRMKRVA
jgi:hypothetical protein